MKRITVLAAVALVVGVWGSLVPAQAAAADVVVDDDGFATPGNCNAATPAPATIQAGVTLATAGQVVQVCPGTYNENVVVDKTLTLRGPKANVDARTRATSNEAVITGTDPTATVQLLADRITFNGFTVSGNVNGSGIYTSPSYAGYKLLDNIVEDNVFGIYLHNGGSPQAIVRENLIQNNNNSGPANGNGIYSDQGAVGVVIAANKFVGNQNAGVLFAGGTITPNADRNIIIKTNRSLNDASFVALFSAVNTEIRQNHVNTTAPQQGSAIFVGGDADGILIDSNVISHPGYAGIAIRDTLGTGSTNVDVLSNTVTGATSDPTAAGIDVSATGYATVNARFNVLDHNSYGIWFESGTSGNVIRANKAHHNTVDCKDDSTGSGTAGTANFWNNDIGAVDVPNGLCKPH
jgi:nitrous oxidase accessory protein NosD